MGTTKVQSYTSRVLERVVMAGFFTDLMHCGPTSYERALLTQARAAFTTDCVALFETTTGLSLQDSHLGPGLLKGAVSCLNYLKDDPLQENAHLGQEALLFAEMIILAPLVGSVRSVPGALKAMEAIQAIASQASVMGYIANLGQMHWSRYLAGSKILQPSWISAQTFSTQPRFQRFGIEIRS